jgi:putative OPT family oligopeptide transporter
MEGAPPEPPPHGFRPFIPASARLRELTWGPLVAGTLLGVVFGASSLYLVLKVGLTVSASIPVAVISITLFRLLARLGVRPATILENNIVQTAGSAGESIAFGVGVTMPAIMILGYDLEVVRVTLVGVLGGLLGILMMIPLRRALIVEQHLELKYPEGTACAEVLKAGASEESRVAAGEAAGEAGAETAGARTIFGGFAIAALYKTAMVALKAWRDVPERVLGAPLAGGSLSAEISPELLGVGYIIGPRVASTMCAGGVLAYLVLIPMIEFFGRAVPGPLAPGRIPIADMAPAQVRGAYVLYIGAGAVAAGGIVSLFRSLPTIWRGLQHGLRDLRASRSGAPDGAQRTEQDLPIRVVVIGLLALVGAISVTPSFRMNLAGALLIVVFGFLFVTVSSRLTGEIGSSSNPISGMTVATLLLTCAIFLGLGWTGPGYYVTALSVGAIVCVAASNGGTTSQDLKTGFLIGATPRAQQIAILVGALASALALGPILVRLDQAATVYVPRVTTERVERDRAVATENFAVDLRADDASKLGEKEPLVGPQARTDHGLYRVWHKDDDVGGRPGRYLVDDSGRAVYFVDPGINGTFATRPDGSKVTKFDAPKATLMSYIIKGILNRQLPWALVLLGVMLAVVLEMCGVPSLPFAVGVYLPLSSSTPILVGGAVRWLADRSIRSANAGGSMTPEELVAEGDKSAGVLLASGFIAGGAIAGIVIAFVAGVLGDAQARIDAWSSASNPFYGGAYADALSLLPFGALVALLLRVGLARTPRPKESRG